MIGSPGMIRLSLTALYLFCSQASMAQYNSEHVMEKSFERVDLFFDSNDLNPYGLGQFTNATPGLIDDPLLNVSVNPAYGFFDSTKSTYFFLDFRNTRMVKERLLYNDYPRYGGVHYGYFCLTLPPVFLEARKSVEPVFSGAVFTRPFPKLTKSWFIGATYQTIFQDEKYYAVPQDIYRSNIGYDYAGNKTLESSDIPIIDRYSGDDEMHQSGHLMAFYSGIDLAKRTRLGVKAARTIFSRDGALGSRNYWADQTRYRDESLYFSMEERDQEYNHWDLAGGINIAVDPKLAIGGMIGYLWADVKQKQTHLDSSISTYGTIGEENNWSYYYKTGNTIENWNHDGAGYYGGSNLDLKLSADKTVQVHYIQHRQDIDIALRSNVADTSYSNYRHQWNEDIYTSESNYHVFDSRYGSGKQRNRDHRFMISLRWQIEERKRLQIGFMAHAKRRTVTTAEHVVVDRYSSSLSTSNYDNYNEWQRLNATAEKKTLNWDFVADQMIYHIPVIFNWQVARTVEMMFGIDRTMTKWEVDDKTLALFDYRRRTIDSEIVTTQNFGERYRQPIEKRTDTETALLGGVTIQPSERFNIRLLVVPNYVNTSEGTDLMDVQWWIGLNMYP